MLTGAVDARHSHHLIELPIGQFAACNNTLPVCNLHALVGNCRVELRNVRKITAHDQEETQ